MILSGKPSVLGQGRAGSAPPFSLADQFGQPTTLRFPQPGAVVLVFTSRHGQATARPWLQALAQLPSPPRVISIACTGWVPGLLQSTIRRAFAQSSPVLLDWNDAVAKQYGYSSNFRLVVISPTGSIVATNDQPFDRDRFTAVSALFH